MRTALGVNRAGTDTTGAGTLTDEIQWFPRESENVMEMLEMKEKQISKKDVEKEQNENNTQDL